ncbi:MAG: carboxypeptidase-like regulatory domain-containing protein, partial [Saprospiraceae bacterium]
MIKPLLTFYLIWFCFYFGSSQSTATIYGTITDGNTGEQMISAIVFDQNSLLGTNSNNYGFYSLSLPVGKVSLKYQYIGFEPSLINLIL